MRRGLNNASMRRWPARWRVIHRVSHTVGAWRSGVVRGEEGLVRRGGVWLKRKGAVRWPCACKLNTVSESCCGALSWLRSYHNHVARGSRDHDGADLYTFARGAMSPSRPRGAKSPRGAATSKELYAPANAVDAKAFFEMGGRQRASSPSNHRRRGGHAAAWRKKLPRRRNAPTKAGRLAWRSMRI